MPHCCRRVRANNLCANDQAILASRVVREWRESATKPAQLPIWHGANVTKMGIRLPIPRLLDLQQWYDQRGRPFGDWISMSSSGKYLKKHTEALVKDVGIEAACVLTGKSKATLGRIF